MGGDDTQLLPVFPKTRRIIEPDDNKREGPGSTLKELL